MNFNRVLGDRHSIVALAGAERRLVRDTKTKVYKMGYDDKSLAYKPINPLILSPIDGKQKVLTGFIIGRNTNWNSFSQDEGPIMFSFYGTPLIPTTIV